MTNHVQAPAAPQKKKKIASLDRRKARSGWLFVLPFVLGFLLVYIPIIYESVKYSLFTYRIVNGGQIKLTIKYKAVDADLANITLRLTYNANVLSFVSGDFQCGAVDAEGNKIFNVENADIGGATPGVIVVSANTFGFGQQPVDKTLNGEGVLAVVYLNIKQDTVAGSTFDFNVDTDAALSPSQVLKADSTPANVHSFGTISNEAKTRALADIDIDANYTSADELEFLGIAFSEDYNAAADINQDGLIGSDDYKLLRDYLLGTITYAEMCAAAQK